MHFFVDFMRGLVPGWRPASGGWVAGNCPVCVRVGEPRTDTKKRGGFLFSATEWRYHCFNCKFATGWSQGSRMSGGVRMLLAGFGVAQSDAQRISIELLREEETAQFLNPQIEVAPPFKPDWKTVELPAQAQPILEIDEVPRQLNDGLEMLAERELTHWTDWAYSSSEMKFKKRMILPYRYQDRVVGYNARYIGNPPEGQAKYLLQKPIGFVFNLDRQHSDREFVIVTEGDYDAITVDGVALGSNSLSEQQASLINQLRKRTIVLPDADEAGAALIEPAIREGWNVSFPEWMEEFKDANAAAQKYGRAFVLTSIVEAAISNPTKIRLLAKRYL